MEGERDLINIIVRPDMFQKLRTVPRNHQLIAVAGRLKRNNRVVDVLIERTLAIDPTVPDPASRSGD